MPLLIQQKHYCIPRLIHVKFMLLEDGTYRESGTSYQKSAKALSTCPWQHKWNKSFISHYSAIAALRKTKPGVFASSRLN